MLALTMSMRLMGPLETLTMELESTRSSSLRARLIRKVALCHDARAIPTLAPFLAAEGRVRAAAIDAIVHFGEAARVPMLDILADRSRSALHPAALRVLEGIVRACPPERTSCSEEPLPVAAD